MANSGKILVAEDSSVMREMLRMLLVREGYEVLFAEDGQQAVEMAITEKPDLVLSDGLLPKMHGFMVCKAIKELESPPKVVLLTGVYTKPSYKWEAKLDFGADDLLLKPFRPDELLACIKKQIGSRPIAGEESRGFEVSDQTAGSSPGAFLTDAEAAGPYPSAERFSEVLA